jgi:hypothetical protein
MRIYELLEGKYFKDLDFVKSGKDGRELDYNLPDDFIHFMNNDDDVYRRHVYPAISRCVDMVKTSQNPTPAVFKLAVIRSYPSYIKQFPIRELPDTLDEKMCREICQKFHEQVCKHVEEGNY